MLGEMPNNSEEEIQPTIEQEEQSVFDFEKEKEAIELRYQERMDKLKDVKDEIMAEFNLSDREMDNQTSKARGIQSLYNSKQELDNSQINFMGSEEGKLFSALSNKADLILRDRNSAVRELEAKREENKKAKMRGITEKLSGGDI